MSAAPEVRQLKRDQFGSVACLFEHSSQADPLCVERDTSAAAWWARWLARRLAGREARALSTLGRVPGVPRLLEWNGRTLKRSWLDGQPMHRSPPTSPDYFKDSLRLLRRLHADGIVHNDLAKEPNWLVSPGQRAALVDFQLAMRPRARLAVPRPGLRRPAPPAQAQADVLPGATDRPAARRARPALADRDAVGVDGKAGLPLRHARSARLG